MFPPPISPPSRPRMTLPGRAVLATLLVLLAIPAAIALATPPTASACPPQGCYVPPDDPAPPPPPPSPPPPKYRLFIDTLRAYETEDSFEDEAYIRVKGYDVWGPHSVNPLQMAYPGVVRDVTGPIWVSLYDEDGPFDSDDWLGDAYTPLPTAVGSTAYGSLHFTQDGANYVMGVRVLRLS
jgi:hypothetical protein